MAFRFRHDIVAQAAADGVHLLTIEQVGMWALLVMALWERGGTMMLGEVVEVVQARSISEKRSLSEDVKRALCEKWAGRTKSERFLLEELSEGEWGFGWLNDHLSAQRILSVMNSERGKQGGRGNTRRRKNAKARAVDKAPALNHEKASALKNGKASALQPAPTDEKRALSEDIGEEKAPALEGRIEGARVRTGVSAELSTLFPSDDVVLRGKRTREPQNDEPAEEPKKRRSLFRNSDVYPIEKFRGQLAKEMSLGIDLDYYWHAVLDWSDVKDTKELRTAAGWVATARVFMRGDAEKKGIKMIQLAENAAQRTADALDYLNLGKEQPR